MSSFVFMSQVLDLSFNNLSPSDVLRLGLLEQLKSLNVSSNNLSLLLEEMSHPLTIEDRDSNETVCV